MERDTLTDAPDKGQGTGKPTSSPQAPEDANHPLSKLAGAKPGESMHGGVLGVYDALPEKAKAQLGDDAPGTSDPDELKAAKALGLVAGVVRLAEQEGLPAPTGPDGDGVTLFGGKGGA